MSDGTRTRIFTVLIGMGFVTLFAGLSVQARAIPLLLAVGAVVGWVAPDIERAWAKSKFWGSDDWRDRHSR